MITFITLDTLVNGSTNWLFQALIGLFISQVLPVLWSIIIAPFTTPGMMWIVTPLLISMTLMQLYFARHRQEELGWNTAFGNSISLIFVSVNLMQFLFNLHGWPGLNVLDPINNKIYLVLGLAGISVIQLLINYFHLIPKKIAFFINSSIPTNMTAYIAIILVYTQIPLSLGALIASLLLLIVLIYLFRLVKGLIPMSKEAEEFVKRTEDKEKRKKEYLEKMELRQERAANAKIIDSLIIVSVILLTFFLIVVLNTFVILPMWVNLLIQSLAYLTTTFILLRARKLHIHNLNFDGEVKEALLGIVMGFVLFFIITGFIYLLWFFVPLTDTMELLLLTSRFQEVGPLSNFLLLGLLVPFSVEIVFRGVIHRSIRGFFKKHVSVSIQAVLFAIITFTFSLLSGFFVNSMFLTIPVLFVAGLLLGYLRDKWGLESAITAHMTFNLLGLVLLFMVS